MAVSMETEEDIQGLFLTKKHGAFPPPPPPFFPRRASALRSPMAALELESAVMALKKRGDGLLGASVVLQLRRGIWRAFGRKALVPPTYDCKFARERHGIDPRNGNLVITRIQGLTSWMVYKSHSISHSLLSTSKYRNQRETAWVPMLGTQQKSQT